MKVNTGKRRIAILGGGPSGMFIYKNFVEAGRNDLEIHIFETKKQLGAGMPYSADGANLEHVTNVSDNEIPKLVTSMEDFIETLPEKTLSHFNIDKSRFTEYKVVPRLLFGQYLSAQFDLLLEKAKKSGIKTVVHLSTNVIDIADKPEIGKVSVEISEKGTLEFDHIVICTGHKWPVKYEGKVEGYFDSPYPPSKLAIKVNHPVAIKGSSLTAIDAIRTLARNNGAFKKLKNGKLSFETNKHCPDFKLIMHSRNGLLPAVRFHLEEPQVTMDSLLGEEEIEKNIADNNGFLSLDFVFEKDFKEQFRDKNPEFYDLIKDLDLETFVDAMMDRRESKEPFQLLRMEYAEAEKSIERKESIYWKEKLAVLSFAMNYPAKYFSAEDTLRLQKVLMPLIAVVIAFVPQSSCEELLALNDAGKLEIISVGSDSEVKPGRKEGAIYYYTDENGSDKKEHYQTFVDCVGQKHLSYADFPFKSLHEQNAITPARLKFKSKKKGQEEMEKKPDQVERNNEGDYLLKVSGIAITDNFQIVGQNGEENDRIYVMAVPYIGGFNPDYSGLDFCEEASEKIVKKILATRISPVYQEVESPAL